MGTNYIAPMWRMPENTNKDKLSNYSVDLGAGFNGRAFLCGPADEEFKLDSTVSLFVLFDSTSSSSAGFQNFLFSRVRTSGYYNSNFAVRLEREPTGFRIKALYGPGDWKNTTTISSQNLYSYDVYHHLAITLSYTGSAYNFTIWVDGVADVPSQSPVTMSALGLPPINTSIHNFCIGGVPNPTSIRTQETFYDGNVAQCSIFDYALNSTQISYLSEGNNPMAMSAPAKLYWPLADNMNINTVSNISYAPNTSVGADSVFDFDRSTQDEILIDENNNKLFQGVSAFTVSAWVKLKTNTGYDHGVVGNDGVSTRGFYMTMKNSPQLRFFVSTTGTTSDAFTYTNPTSTLNRWVHYVVIWDGSNMDMYVDGMYSQTQACVNATGTFTAPVGTVIGGPLGQGGDNKYYFDGEISNVQIWYQRLSHGTASVGDVAGGDIATLYNNGQPIMTGAQPQEANLKAWYKLNQSSNWEADTTGNWQIPDATSAFPQSFKFISSDTSQINLGDVTYLDGASELTLSAWVKPTAAGTAAADAIFGKDGSTRGFYLATYTGNKFRFFVSTTGSSNDSFNSNASYTIGEWIHLAATWDGSNMKIYINGSEDNTRTTTNATGTLQNNSNPFEIGNLGNYNGPLNAFLSNAQVWTTALPATGSNSIETLYNNGVPLTTAIATDNLKLWYKLNNNELFDGTNWSVENQKYPANYESALKFPGNFVGGTGIRFSPITINVTQANTYSAWVYPIGGTNYWTMLTGAYSGTTPRIAPISLQSLGGSSWSIRSTQRSMNTTANTVVSNAISNNELGKWHHIMVVVNNLDVSFYLNGQPHGTATFTNPWTSSTFDLFTIGEFSNWIARGYMSNIAIWNSDQSTNIANIYNNGTPQNSYTVEPIALWKLDNTTTGINDIIGGRTGTLTGDITKVNTFVSKEAGGSSGMTEQSLVYNNVSVKNGESSGMNTTNIVQSNLTRKVPYSSYSTSFLGTTDYFTSTPSIGITNAITISAWVKIPTTNTTITLPQQIICEDNTSGTERNWLLYYRNQGGTNNHFIFSVFHTDGSSTSITSSGITPNNGLWQHVVGTFDGTTNANGFKLYVNGQQAATPVTASSTGVRSTSGVGPSIGALEHGFWPIDAHISNCAVWEAAITQDDVLNLYNNGITQDLNNFRLTPYAWWPLDENSTYFNGSVLVARDLINAKDVTGVNLIQSNIIGNAPSSENAGKGFAMASGFFLGKSKNSVNNSYSINMADYADGVTNPANSGRSTDTPS